VWGPNPAARDRRYMHLSSTLRSMQVLLGACVGEAEAERLVSHVNRTVVVVGPARHCSLRHPTRFESSFLGVNGIL